MIMIESCNAFSRFSIFIDIILWERMLQVVLYALQTPNFVFCSVIVEN